MILVEEWGNPEPPEEVEETEEEFDDIDPYYDYFEEMLIEEDNKKDLESENF